MSASTDLTPTERFKSRVMADLEQLFEDLRINEQRNELVRELDSAILRSTFSPQQVLDLIVAKCLSRTAADHGQVVLYRQGRLIVAASSEQGRIGEELPLNTSLCGNAVREKEDQHCSDVSRLPPDSYVRYHESTRSELIVLIRTANDDRVLGVIDLERNTEGPFPDNALAFARLLAGEAAIAIEHARIGTSVKTLYEISNAVASGTLTLRQSCDRILTALLSNSAFEDGQILIRERDKLVIVASSRKEDIDMRLGEEFSVCGRYLLHEHGRTILVIGDIEQSPYRPVYLGLLGRDDKPMRSEMIIPLLDDSGSLVGALNIESPYVEAFTKPDASFFGAVGNFLAGAILAALAREKQHAQEEQIRMSNLAMTQLGSVAQSFVHRFSNTVGNVRSRMKELRGHLSYRQVPPLRGAVPAGQFIQELDDSLGEAVQIIKDFSKRFNPGGTGFQFHDIDLASTGKDLIDKYRRRYAGTGIDFSFDDGVSALHQGKIPVRGQATCRLTDQIREVVENLLDNAVRAVVERPSGPEGGAIAVTVRLNDASFAQLRVTDNGVGIPAKDHPNIFDFDYSTRKDKGASHGIGLWFCQYYVLQVGGKLTFGSVEGKGSWFEIEFPTIAVPD